MSWLESAPLEEIDEVHDKLKKRRTQLWSAKVKQECMKLKAEFNGTEFMLRERYRDWWVYDDSRKCDSGACVWVECGQEPATEAFVFALVPELAYCFECLDLMAGDIATRPLEPFEENLVDEP